MQNNSLTQLEKKEITEVFLTFGLKEKEQKLYIALLSSGSSTITPLAKNTGLPPTTVQSMLFRLQKIGIITSIKRKSRNIYQAAPPNTFKEILEHQLQDFKNVIPLLHKIKKDDQTNTKIHAYYRDRIADIFHQALSAKNKIIYEIVSAKDIQELLGEKFHFTKRRVEKKINLKSLRVEKNEIKKYSEYIHERELREAKFLPRELTFMSSIMFWDDIVAFFSTKNEGIAWVVKSAVMYEMMKQLFDLLWSLGRKMENDYSF